MRRRRRARPKAPFSGERFILMPEWVLLHLDWRTAPTGALTVIIDLHKHWTGQQFNNNGRIGYGVRTAASPLAISKDTAGALLRWLVDHDWIRPGEDNWRPFTADGRRRQREWQITYLPTHGRVPVRRESAAEAKPSNAGRRIKIEHRLLNSPAYASLSPSAKTLLIEVIRRFDGGNNGRIEFGGEDGWGSGIKRDATERVLHQLEDRAFIVEASPADPLESTSRSWLLTIYPGPGSKKPRNDFLRWASDNQLTCPSNADTPTGSVPKSRMVRRRRKPEETKTLDETAEISAV